MREPRDVVARQAEDVGDDLGRDLGGVARDEVDLPLPQPVADEALRATRIRGRRPSIRRAAKVRVKGERRRRWTAPLP